MMITVGTNFTTKENTSRNSREQCIHTNATSSSSSSSSASTKVAEAVGRRTSSSIYKFLLKTYAYAQCVIS